MVDGPPMLRSRSLNIASDFPGRVLGTHRLITYTWYATKSFLDAEFKSSLNLFHIQTLSVSSPPSWGRSKRSSIPESENANQAGFVYDQKLNEWQKLASGMMFCILIASPVRLQTLGLKEWVDFPTRQPTSLLLSRAEFEKSIIGRKMNQFFVFRSSSFWLCISYTSGKWTRCIRWTISSKSIYW